MPSIFDNFRRDSLPEPNDPKDESGPISNDLLAKQLEGKRIQGKIIKLDSDRGYGFIVSHDLKFIRIYFHWSALVHNTKTFNELTKGMVVEFEAKYYPEQGWRALRIEIKS